MAVSVINDPTYKNFLSKVLNDFGFDITQPIDMNDPMTKLVMTIAITNTEQGRDVYNYDQFIKGCAASIGIDPATMDNAINPTTLGFENNSGSVGYVPPTLPSILRGGSSIPLNYSSYISAGIAATAASGQYNGFGFGGITSPFNSSSAGVVNPGSVTSAAGAGTFVPVSAGGLTPGTLIGDAALKSQLESVIAQDRIDAGLPPTLSNAEWSALKGAVGTEGGDPGATMAAILNRSYAGGDPIDAVVFSQSQFSVVNAVTGSVDPITSAQSGRVADDMSRFNSAALNPATATMGQAVNTFQKPYDAGVTNFNSVVAANPPSGTPYATINNQRYAIGSPDANYNVNGEQNSAKWQQGLANQGKTIPNIPADANQAAAINPPDGYKVTGLASNTVTDSATGKQIGVPVGVTMTKDGKEYTLYTSGPKIGQIVDNQGTVVSQQSTASNASTGTWTTPPPASALGLSSDWKGPATYGPDGKLTSQTFINPKDPNDYITVGVDGKIITNTALSDTTSNFNQIGTVSAAATPPLAPITNIPSSDTLGLPAGTSVTSSAISYTTDTLGVKTISSVQKVEYTTPDGTVFNMDNTGKLTNASTGAVVGNYIPAAAAPGATGIMSTPLPVSTVVVKEIPIMTEQEYYSSTAGAGDYKTYAAAIYAKNEEAAQLATFTVGQNTVKTATGIDMATGQITYGPTMPQDGRSAGQIAQGVVGSNQTSVASVSTQTQSLIDQGTNIGSKIQTNQTAITGLNSDISAINNRLTGMDGLALPTGADKTNLINQQATLTGQLNRLQNDTNALEAQQTLIANKISNPSNGSLDPNLVSAIQSNTKSNLTILGDPVATPSEKADALAQIQVNNETLASAQAAPAVVTATPAAPYNGPLTLNQQTVITSTNIDEVQTRIDANTAQRDALALQFNENPSQPLENQIAAYNKSIVADQTQLISLQAEQANRANILSPDYQEPGYSTLSDSYALNPLPTKSDTMYASQTPLASDGYSMASFNQSETNLLGNAPLPVSRPADLAVADTAASPNLPIFAQGDVNYTPLQNWAGESQTTATTAAGFNLSGFQTATPTVNTDTGQTTVSVGSVASSPPNVPGTEPAGGTTSPGGTGAAPAAGAPPGVPKGC